jgi:Ran GTPase-activating protein (RanGAP) involved in mRNA processing and transport
MKPIETNKYLKEIFLKSNNFNEDSVKFICDVIEKNSTIEEINLEGNKISSSGIKQLINSLQKNHTILELNCGTEETEDDTDEIGKILDRNADGK